MLTLFQKSLLGTIALAGLLLALVIAAKTPAQATTISPAVQVPIGLVPPGIVTTGDATVRVKPDAAIVTVGAIAQGATAEEAQTLLAQRIGTVLERAKTLAIEDKDTKTVTYRIDPQYAYEQGKAPRLVGFQGNQQIALTLHGTRSSKTMARPRRVLPSRFSTARRLRPRRASRRSRTLARRRRPWRRPPAWRSGGS